MFVKIWVCVMFRTPDTDSYLTYEDRRSLLFSAINKPLTHLIFFTIFYTNIVK